MIVFILPPISDTLAASQDKDLAVQDKRGAYLLCVSGSLLQHGFQQTVMVDNDRFAFVPSGSIIARSTLLNTGLVIRSSLVVLVALVFHFRAAAWKVGCRIEKLQPVFHADIASNYIAAKLVF